MPILPPAHPLRTFKLSPTFFAHVNAMREEVTESARQLAAAGTPLSKEKSVELEVFSDSTTASVERQLYQFARQTTALGKLADFWWLSRKIYQFEPDLAEELSHTTIDDVPCDAILFPVPDFYLCWGDYGQTRFRMARGEYLVDGAYVKVAPRNASAFASSLHIDFSTRMCDRVLAEGDNPVESTFLYLIGLDDKLLLGEAITKGESEYISHVGQLDLQGYQSAVTLLKHYGVPSAPEAPACCHAKHWQQSAPFIREALPVLFNCLAYLSAYPEDCTEKLPEDAPASIKQPWTAAVTANERHQALGQAAKKGYSTVVLVSDPKIKASGPSQATGRKMPAHWRKGHWRLQPYGEGRARVRLKRIRPVYVGHDDTYPGIDHGQVTKI